MFLLIPEEPSEPLILDFAEDSKNKLEASLNLPSSERVLKVVS